MKNHSFFHHTCRSWFAWIMILFCVPACLESCNRSDNPENDHPALVEAILNQADSIKYEIGVDSSIAFLNTSYRNLPNPSIMDVFKKYDFIMAIVTFDRINYARAQAYTDSILNLFRNNHAENKYRKEYGKGYIWQGKILRAQGNYSEAYRYFYEGKLIVEPTMDTCALDPYNNQIANVYFDQANYRRAGEYYLKAYENAMHCPDGSSFDEVFVERQGNLSNVAICYTLQGMQDSAVHYYNRALAYIQENEARYPDQKNFMDIARAVVNTHMSDVYVAKKDFQKAEYLLKTSIEVNAKRGRDNRFAQKSQARLIDVYLQTGQLEKAETELHRLKVSLDTLPNVTVRQSSYQLEGRYFEEIGDYKNAFHFFTLHSTLKDSVNQYLVNKVGFDQILAGLSSQHQLELYNQRQAFDRFYLIGAICSFLTVLVIAFLIWKNWKRSQRNVAELSELNHQIASQNNHMQNALNALEQSQLENKRMMKVVAHDLRNPIGAISMAATMMLENESYSDEQRDFLEMISISAADSIKLIENLLQSNISPDTLNKDWVELHVVLMHCVNMLKFKASEKKQRIDLQTESLVVFLDREKMWRVISNLVGNAVKFSPFGAAISVRMKLNGQVILLSVEDHGIGIPAQLKENIFDVFTVAKRQGTSGEQSFGLGLAISRQIVKAHGGKLWFESEPDQGTTFFVELPYTPLQILR